MLIGADISHHNGPVDLARARSAGLAFLFHKATQGIGYIDPKFLENKLAAADASLPFGAYHFGTGDDPEVQAQHFLAVAARVPVLALDFEDNLSGPKMTVEQAEVFVQTVEAATGQKPILYAGGYLKSQSKGSLVLIECPLWLSHYSSRPVPPRGWNKWTFLQYTDGNLGPIKLVGQDQELPHSIDGIGPCDCDLWPGTLDDLTAFWSKGASNGNSTS